MIAPRRVPRRRGGILLEVLISIALFAGAGAFALRATSSVFGRLDRLRTEQLAADIAASRLDELAAGIITLADLRDEEIVQVGSRESFGAFDESMLDAPIWIVEAETERSEFPGLTLVALTVRLDDGYTDFDDPAAIGATIRRLVRLRGEDADEYEADDMLDGVPEAAP